MTTTGDDPGWTARGVEIIVDLSRGRMNVLRAAPIRHLPRLHLRAPRLTPENLPNVHHDASEIVISVLDAEGRAAQSFALPVRARTFVDYGDPESESWYGGPRLLRPDEPDIRSVRLPWPDGTRGLLSYRTEVVWDHSIPPQPRLVYTPLGLFGSGDDGVDRAELPPGLKVEGWVPLPWPPPWQPGVPRPLPGFDPGELAGDGHLADVVQGESDQYQSRFDIVIAGDGFAAGELGVFETLANDLRAGLEAIEPFASLAGTINWHVARVVSTDSGVDRCPDPVPVPALKNTFFQVEGCWAGTEAPGYLGTNELGRVHWVAEHVAPWEFIDLFIIISNCVVWGGHAWPDAKLAILSRHQTKALALAAHECAHVIARLAEETICCIPELPEYEDPNLARLLEVGASVARHLQPAAGTGLPMQGKWTLKDTVWWKGLACPSELNPDGTFGQVHVPGDPVDPNDLKSPLVAAGQKGAVGAFWGCQNTWSPQALLNGLVAFTNLGVPQVADLVSALRAGLGSRLGGLMDLTEECDRYWDVRGAYYFRPSAVCTMRYPTYPFCRVCRHLIMNAVYEAAGCPLVPPLP